MSDAARIFQDGDRCAKCNAFHGQGLAHSLCEQCEQVKDREFEIFDGIKPSHLWPYWRKNAESKRTRAVR